MKVISFNVPKTNHEAFRLQIDRVPHLYDKLHQHPETQIMYIVKGEGTLIAGDYIGRFQPGDVFLLGSLQAHVFRNDAAYYQSKTKKQAHAISLYFDENYAGTSFWQLDELKHVRNLLHRSKGGLQLFGNTRTASIDLIERLQKAESVDKLILFLELLKVISRSKELKTLSVVSLRTDLSSTEGKRMNAILQFTFQQSHRPIYLDEIAAIANLSIEAFCRFFKTRTRKTYTNFLNEVRVSQACRLLISSDKPIQLIAFETGFNNLSHFNRVFKKLKGQTPRSYLKTRALTS